MGVGEPDVLWGMPSGRLVHWRFDHVSIGGQPVTSLEHFRHNEYVSDFQFR